ncbi:MAG: LacI family transcriptional regulator [Treponema sp.]|jgi:LacI family transcriptional regulator|nr:LacI family transcriptional regulator [Treponema sp.]
MISIKDIARQLGVSPSTVSRVVNGKKHVNPAKREQILKIIAETGYVPNKAARSMVLRRSFTVGIVIPDTFNMFQRQLFSIIERHLESFGYHTLFFFVQFDEASEEECLNRVKSEKLDGLIMLQEIKASAFYDYLNRVELPVVSATFCASGIPAIHVNEEQAAMDAVNHLIGLGHRKIAMLSGSGFTFGRQRAEGFFQALEAAGEERDEGRVVFVRHYAAEFGMYGMRELLLRGRDFSAVFAATDELAIGAIRVLRDEGLRVPEDVSVIGFDDIEISNFMIPRLTTIRQPLWEMGEQTALALHRHISGNKGGRMDTVLPYRLIIRESTCPCRRGKKIARNPKKQLFQQPPS